MKTITGLKEFDHVMWIAKLKHLKSEIVSLESKLAAIASGSSKSNVLARVEHFQNQFIVQKSNVNDILHAIKMDEKNQRYELVMDSPALEKRKSAYPPEKDLAETFEKTMQELKSEFAKFESKWK
jgi:hypothetical protein